MLPNVRPQNIGQFLLYTRVTEFGGRQKDVLSFEELVLHPIVVELFELLECHKRSGAHAPLIFALPACDYNEADGRRTRVIGDREGGFSMQLFAGLLGRKKTKAKEPTWVSPRILRGTSPGNRPEFPYANRNLLDSARNFNGDLSAVQQALKTGADVNCREEDGGTPLMFAAVGGHIQLVRFLLENGADLHAVQRDGYTALHFAAIFGHAGIVEELVSAGASTEARNNAGKTALDIVTSTLAKTHGAVAAVLRQHSQKDV